MKLIKRTRARSLFLYWSSLKNEVSNPSCFLFVENVCLSRLRPVVPASHLIILLINFKVWLTTAMVSSLFVIFFPFFFFFRNPTVLLIELCPLCSVYFPFSYLPYLIVWKWKLKHDFFFYRSHVIKLLRSRLFPAHFRGIYVRNQLSAV